MIDNNKMIMENEKTGKRLKIKKKITKWEQKKKSKFRALRTSSRAKNYLQSSFSVITKNGDEKDF